MPQAPSLDLLYHMVRFRLKRMESYPEESFSLFERGYFRAFQHTFECLDEVLDLAQEDEELVAGYAAALDSINACSRGDEIWDDAGFQEYLDEVRKHGSET